MAKKIIKLKRNAVYKKTGQFKHTRLCPFDEETICCLFNRVYNTKCKPLLNDEKLAEEIIEAYGLEVYKFL